MHNVNNQTTPYEQAIGNGRGWGKERETLWEIVRVYAHVL